MTFWVLRVRRTLARHVFIILKKLICNAFGGDGFLYIQNFKKYSFAVFTMFFVVLKSGARRVGISRPNRENLTALLHSLSR